MLTLNAPKTLLILVKHDLFSPSSLNEMTLARRLATPGHLATAPEYAATTFGKGMSGEAVAAYGLPQPDRVIQRRLGSTPEPSTPNRRGPSTCGFSRRV